MREIKFRAWDSKQEEMLFTGDYPTDEAVMQLMDIDWEGLGILFDGDIIACDECGRFAYLQNDRYVLMQYTGLKDKNDKEIYEGDILFDFDCGLEKDCVIFEEGAFWCFGGGGSDFIHYEKLGNIYENPDIVV